MNANASIAPSSTFIVDGLKCASCIAKLENRLQAEPGVVAARVNFTTRRLRVDHFADLSDDRILTVIAELGFTSHLLASDSDEKARSETRRLALCMAVAGFAAMNIMLLSVSIWSGADGATRQLFHWLSALIAFPAIAYAGRPFFSSAIAVLRKGRTNMDVPISIGVTLTLAMSLYETIIGGPHAYFDGVTMLLFFLLCGRFLDSVMRARASNGVAALLEKLPSDATVVLPDRTIRRPIADLTPGMRVLVAAGERIPADGIVVIGESEVDRSLVTGESLPERVSAGTTVLAGTVNLSAPLTMLVSKAAHETAIADIARLMENATQSKSLYVRIADRASRLYAPAVHSLAALTFAGWMLAGAGWHEAATNAVAVLIITCPCALGLAVPIAQVVVSGALMRVGILVKDGSALERLAAADAAMLDKTGTITTGQPSIPDGMPEGAVERSVLLALAQASRHPVALAIARDLIDSTPADLSDLVERPGYGLSGFYQGQEVMFGRPEWVAPGQDCDGARVSFRMGKGTVHGIRMTDPPRSDAGAALARLQALGLPCTILSGDDTKVVDAMVKRFDVTGSGRLTPHDKVQAIQWAQDTAGRHVLMVGDGLNDGPALKAASVSMAPSSATDVGQMAADVVFMGDRLMAVPIAVSASRRSMTIVRENFVLAVGYNALAVPLAVLGYVTPLVAALAMSGSSLLVVANALRLRSAAR